MIVIDDDIITLNSKYYIRNTNGSSDIDISSGIDSKVLVNNINILGTLYYQGTAAEIAPSWS